MGVLNLTPDSFSDGGKYASGDAALKHAESMVADGADWIDIGAESTRPGSSRVQRIGTNPPACACSGALRKQCPVILSIDTTLAEVGEFALDQGVDVINDISAGRDDPALLPLVASRKAPIVLMHMQGTPLTMQIQPQYHDVIGEIRQFFQERIEVAEGTGVSRSHILLDPGIGFGKTLEHNLRILRRLRELSIDNLPMVVGTSRKGFIQKVTGETAETGRPFGTAATVAWSVMQGASVVRVHEVAQMAQVVRMIEAIQTTVG